MLKAHYNSFPHSIEPAYTYTRVRATVRHHHGSIGWHSQYGNDNDDKQVAYDPARAEQPGKPYVTNYAPTNKCRVCEQEEDEQQAYCVFLPLPGDLLLFP